MIRDRAKEVKAILEKHDVLGRIKTNRHNILAHNNAKVLTGKNNISEDYPIEYDSVEGLLEDTGHILACLNPEPGNIYVYKQVAKDSEREAKAIMRALEYFYSEKKHHSEMFVHGEIDDPTFPPKKNRES